MDLETARVIAGAIALIPILGVGIGLGHIFGSYYIGVSRNPDIQDKIKTDLLFGFAVTEALAIFSLGMSLIILMGILG